MSKQTHSLEVGDRVENNATGCVGRVIIATPDFVVVQYERGQMTYGAGYFTQLTYMPSEEDIAARTAPLREKKRQAGCPGDQIRHTQHGTPVLVSRSKYPAF